MVIRWDTSPRGQLSLGRRMTFLRTDRIWDKRLGQDNCPAISWREEGGVAAVCNRGEVWVSKAIGRAEGVLFARLRVPLYVCFVTFFFFFWEGVR